MNDELPFQVSTVDKVLAAFATKADAFSYAKRQSKRNRGTFAVWINQHQKTTKTLSGFSNGKEQSYE